jgi:hypothetical protein
MISIRSLRAEGIGSVKFPVVINITWERSKEIVVAEGIVLFWVENL